MSDGANQGSEGAPSGEAPAAASPQPAGAPAAAPPAAGPVRPEGLPDDLWDATAGVKTGDLWSRFKDREAEVETLKGERGEVPADAAGYELKLPEDVKLPDGFTAQLDPNDPFLKAAQEHAKAAGWSTKQWGAAVGLEAKRQAAAAEQAAAYQRAEEGKLGEQGGARIKATNDWLSANLTQEQAAALAPRSAAAVQALEAIIRQRQGAAPAPGAGGPAANQFEGKTGRSRLEAIFQSRAG